MAAVVLLAGEARAQFNNRFIRIGAGGTDVEVNSATEAAAIANLVNTGGPGIYGNYQVLNNTGNVLSSQFSWGGGGLALTPVNNYPGATTIDPGQGTSDFVIVAGAHIFIPAGTWQIAFGGDDGGILTVAGASITNAFNENGTVTANDSTLIYDAPRGIGYTGGRITLGAGAYFTLSTVQYERGGGDAFQIAIRNAAGGDNNTVSAANGWVVLEQGALGWAVSPVPEPATVALLGVGLAGAFAFARRRRSA